MSESEADLCNCCRRRPKVGALLCAECNRAAAEEAEAREAREGVLSLATFKDDRGHIHPHLTIPNAGEGLRLRGWEPPTSFRFVDENGKRDVLVLHRDGRVEVGAHLTPDEAGQRVFEILRDLWARHMGTPEALVALAGLQGVSVEDAALSAIRDIVAEWGPYPGWEAKWPEVARRAREMKR